MTHRC